ncbi:MAG TPA: BON domain-containing protein, partial [Gemmatimonadales bacterium]|nr:BON domain-containing protein [Gemmatimonadales bacterium]
AGLRAQGLSAGVVELRGWVASRAARARAARLVADLPGVDAVVNHLLVRGEDDLPAPDLRLADQSA